MVDFVLDDSFQSVAESASSRKSYVGEVPDGEGMDSVAAASKVELGARVRSATDAMAGVVDEILHALRVGPLYVYVTFRVID